MSMMSHAGRRTHACARCARRLRTLALVPWLWLALQPHAVATPGDAVVDASRAVLRAAVVDSARQPRPSLLDRAQLLGDPAVTDVQLSPDGRHLMFRSLSDGRGELLLQALDGGERRRILADARGYRALWSVDGARIWLADETGLGVYEVADAAARRILKWDADRRQRLWQVDAHAPGHAVVSERVGSGGAWRYRYLRVDARGELQLLAESALPLRGVLLAGDGTLRYSVAYDGPAYDSVIRRHDADGDRELLRCVGIEQCRLVGHDAEALLVLSQRGGDRVALQRWRTRDARWETLHADPDALTDASALLWRPGTADWLAIGYHPDRLRWYGRDPALDAKLAALRRQLPSANLVLNTSADGRRWLVTASHATWVHERHYVYSPASETLRPLFADAAVGDAPSSAQLSPAQPVRYRARDGLLIHGYVYLPRGVPTGQAPLIAMVHGGPYNRDRGGFDPFIQLLVNRGCIVFTPNFRGSTGYGLRHLRAAAGDFGNGQVLGDLLDGLDVLLEEGIGDREKQSIVGHSFGGYASLLAASHVPERFRYALAGAAPVDFGWVTRWITDRGDSSALPEDGPPGEILFAHYGEPVADAAWRSRMQADSPLAHVAALRTPVYLWAGAGDDRVPLKSIARYAAEAARAGTEAVLLVDPDAGHSPGDRLGFEAAAYLYEAAAAKHFGVRVAPPSDALRAFLERNLRLGELR